MDDLPKKNGSDCVYDTTRAALSAIPVVGGPASVLFESVISAPIEKRKEDWLKKLGETLADLSEKVENLSSREDFVSSCIQASHIAVRTHDKEKLDALIEAIKSSAFCLELDESKKWIFLRTIDEITVLHLRVLYFLNDLKSVKKKHQVNNPFESASNIWDKENDEVNSRDPVIRLITKDLNRYGFITKQDLDDITADSPMTELGREFLSYVGR